MTEPESARESLTQAVLENLLAGEGLDRSLRAFAGAIGVSHSLLLYHFGSKDGLFAAVHDACERRERVHLAAFRAQDVDPYATMRRMWVHLADPAMLPLYRVGFALRSRQFGSDAGASAAADAREPWIADLLPLVRAVGVPPRRAWAEALLWLSTSRGLLWELATGAAPEAVNAAAEAFFLHYGPGPEPGAAT